MDGLTVFNRSICTPNENYNSEPPDPYIAVVEIKTGVGSVTVARGMEHATPELIACEINSADFRAGVPTEHAAQLLHHCAAFGTLWLFYLCASDSQILYVVLSVALVRF